MPTEPQSYNAKNGEPAVRTPIASTADSNWSVQYQLHHFVGTQQNLASNWDLAFVRRNIRS